MSEMTPKEALRTLIMYGPANDVDVDQEYFDAIDTLRALVEQYPIIQESTVTAFAFTPEQYLDLIKRLANILFKLQPTWAFTGDPFVTLDAIERALEIRPTVQEVREEIERLIDNANNCHGVAKDPYHSGLKAGLGVLLNFIDAKARK